MFAIGAPGVAKKLRDRPPPVVVKKKASSSNKKASSSKTKGDKGAGKKDPNAPKLKSLFWDVLRKKQVKGTLFDGGSSSEEEEGVAATGAGAGAGAGAVATPDLIESMYKDLTTHFARAPATKKASKKKSKTAEKDTRVSARVCACGGAACQHRTASHSHACLLHWTMPLQPQVLDGKLRQNMNIALNRVSRIPMTAIADGIQRLDMSGLGDAATTQDMVRLFLSLDCYETELLDKMRVRVCVVVFVFSVWRLACVHSTCLTVF